MKHLFSLFFASFALFFFAPYAHAGANPFHGSLTLVPTPDGVAADHARAIATLTNSPVPMETVTITIYDPNGAAVAICIGQTSCTADKAYDPTMAGPVESWRAFATAPGGFLQQTEEVLIPRGVPATHFVGNLDLTLTSYQWQPTEKVFATAHVTGAGPKADQTRFVFTVDGKREIGTCSGYLCTVRFPVLPRGCHFITVRAYDTHNLWTQLADVQFVVGNDKTSLSCPVSVKTNRTSINNDESIRIEARVNSKAIPTDKLMIELYEAGVDTPGHYIKRCVGQRVCTLMLSMSAADGLTRTMRFYAIASNGEAQFLPFVYSSRISHVAKPALLTGTAALTRSYIGTGASRQLILTGTVAHANQPARNLQLLLINTETEQVLKRCVGMTRCSMQIRVGLDDVVQGQYYLQVRDRNNRELVPAYLRF